MSSWGKLDSKQLTANVRVTNGSYAVSNATGNATIFLDEVKPGDTNCAGSPVEGSGKVPYQVMDETELTEEEMEEASGCHEGMEEGAKSCQLELEWQEMEEEETCNECKYCKKIGRAHV